MTVRARILLDSLGPSGKRITTWEFEYPRMVHAELMTHRAFSRNSASSRAIPTRKLRERIQANPAMPVFWGKNQRGMQAAVELEPGPRAAAEALWLRARDEALATCEKLEQLELHKQLANRPLEAWMHITVIVSATEFSNWFWLRHHPMAQPEIRELARQTHALYKASKPRQLAEGEWHIPFLKDEDLAMDIETRLKVATGRLARVSYLNHDGVRSVDDDIALHDQLLNGAAKDPGHWSPFEHCARAETTTSWNRRVASLLNRADFDEKPFNHLLLGNFIGWTQYRKDLAERRSLDEGGFDFDWEKLES